MCARVRSPPLSRQPSSPSRPGAAPPGRLRRGPSTCLPTWEPPGTRSSYVAITGIAAGSGGALRFTESGRTNGPRDRIGRMTTDGRLRAWPLARRAAPTRIAAGPDGALWFTEQDAHAIGRITTAGALTEFPLVTGTSPSDVVAGADGALWFTADACIGRITTAGGGPCPGSDPGHGRA